MKLHNGVKLKISIPIITDLNVLNNYCNRASLKITNKLSFIQNRTKINKREQTKTKNQNKKNEPTSLTQRQRMSSPDSYESLFLLFRRKYSFTIATSFSFCVLLYFNNNFISFKIN